MKKSDLAHCFIQIFNFAIKDQGRLIRSMWYWAKSLKIIRKCRYKDKKSLHLYAAELFVSIFRQVKLELQTQFPASLTKTVYICFKTDISQIHLFYKMINFHKLFFLFYSLCTGLVVQGLRFQRQYRIITRIW